MIRKIPALAGACIATCLTGTVVHATVLFDNSPVQNSFDVLTGNNGTNNVSLTPPLSNGSYATTGYQDGAAATGTVPTDQLADDITLSSASTINNVIFDEYTTTYPAVYTALAYIYSAQPGTAGATILATSTGATTASTNIYRAAGSAPTSTSRLIMAVTATFNPLTLPAGTYWVDYGVTSETGGGTTAFSPAVTYPDANGNSVQPTGNAIQTLNGGTSYAPIADQVGDTVGLPLIVNGTAVPEPATAGLIAVGASAFVAHRRRRQA